MFTDQFVFSVMERVGIFNCVLKLCIATQLFVYKETVGFTIFDMEYRYTIGSYIMNPMGRNTYCFLILILKISCH